MNRFTRDSGSGRDHITYLYKIRRAVFPSIIMQGDRRLRERGFPILESFFVCSLNPIRRTSTPQPLFHFSIILSSFIVLHKRLSAYICFELRTLESNWHVFTYFMYLFYKLWSLTTRNTLSRQIHWSSLLLGLWAVFMEFTFGWLIKHWTNITCLQIPIEDSSLPPSLWTITIWD